MDKDAEILETIKTTLRDVMEIEIGDLDENTTLASLNLDSLDMVELTCFLEEEYCIDFGVPEGLNTIGDVIAYVKELDR